MIYMVNYNLVLNIFNNYYYYYIFALRDQAWLKRSGLEYRFFFLKKSCILHGVRELF